MLHAKLSELSPRSLLPFEHSASKQAHDAGGQGVPEPVFRLRSECVSTIEFVDVMLPWLHPSLCARCLEQFAETVIIHDATQFIMILKSNGFRGPYEQTVRQLNILIVPLVHRLSASIVLKCNGIVNNYVVTVSTECPIDPTP